jgi:hypothetical protein
VKEYTEEFYKLKIRVGQRERDEEKVARYINGLRYEIQYELNMVTVRAVEDVYQMALKAEENLARKHSHHNRGRNLNRGKGVAQDKAKNPKDKAKKPHSQFEGGGSYHRRQSGGRSYFPRGRGRGRGGELRCYSYGKTGHMSLDCLERKKGGEAHISKV